jgi:dTDP-4-dehydrorhamnose 3,5-epimerase
VRAVQTALSDVILVEPDVYRDDRGYFLETYREDKYHAIGIDLRFVQDNQSRSVRGTIRGLHLQLGARPQAKLVRVVEGEIWDVAVDVRRGSPTFGRWVGNRLTAESFTQCYIPGGFAHGFSVLSPVAAIAYKCTELYDPSSEIGIAWDDPALAITWLVDNPVLSERDRRHPPLALLDDRLPQYRATAL